MGKVGENGGGGVELVGSGVRGKWFSGSGGSESSVEKVTILVEKVEVEWVVETPDDEFSSTTNKYNSRTHESKYITVKLVLE